MKLIRIGMIVISTATGLFLLAPVGVQAQATVLEKVTISGTAYQQLAAPTGPSKGGIDTIKAPAKTAITTKTILTQLCADEFAAGNPAFSSASVPAGAVLNYNGAGFEIDKGTNQIADVSADNFFTVTATGQNDVSGAGSYLDANGEPSGDQGTPPFTETDYQLYTVTYDDTGAGGNLQFSVTGLAMVTGKTATPNAKTGNYTQTGTFSLADGTGEGINASGPLVITGFTVTANGSADENSGTGTDE